MFERIKNEIMADHEKNTANALFYIANGFYPTWAEENRHNPDNGLKSHSTALRWSQYQRGEITREKAVELAQKRVVREREKELARKLERLREVELAPDLRYIVVGVEWTRSSTWGHNPHATVTTQCGRTVGTASGCGYDKESTAIAEAFNASPSILKELFKLKETALAAGGSDESRTTCTGRDNRHVCGYGAGYGAMPLFEGGVGVSCYWQMFKACGFKVTESHGKTFDSYSVSREG